MTTEASSDRGSYDPSDRELAAGFAGAAGNLFHPAAAVLQRLDARRHDLLLIRDLGRRSFTSGAAGAADWDALLARLAEIAADHHSIFTIDASMGGAPALSAGVLLSARRATSLGGHVPPDVRASSIDAASSRAADKTELLCVFGASNAHDEAGADGLRERLPRATLIALADIDQHNVLHAAFQRGSLRGLYAMLIDGPMPDATEGLGRSSTVTVRLEPTIDPPGWALPTLSSVVTHARERPLLRRLAASALGQRLSDLAASQPRLFVPVERLIGWVSRTRRARPAVPNEPPGAH